MLEQLHDYISTLENAIELTAPMSQRARVLTSLQRFAERARRTMEFRAKTGDVPGYRMIAQMLEVRDMARKEQSWVDDLLRDEVFEPDHEDLLLAYKMLLAVVESSTMMAIGYIGSDKEDAPESSWWAAHAGGALVHTLAIVPQLMALPEDRKA